eukprot:NODE_21_length_42443_cov_0.822808.p4 type:complete len:772 gc:universal NODE_21_length_42443_cov_0.822808:8905-6590(-)
MMEPLRKQLRYNKYECSICCDKIYRNQKIWHCSECCFSIFHFKCIKLWTKDKAEWCCPKCNQTYVQLSLSCFCGKGSGQSCNNTCQRFLPCGHKCPVRCHPGRCPPCDIILTEPRTCYCGKLSVSNILCHETKTFTCRKQCNKGLSCSHHECTDLCHEGSCKQCDQIVEVYCRCLTFKKKINCSSNYELVKKENLNGYSLLRATLIPKDSFLMGSLCKDFCESEMQQIQEKCRFKFLCNNHECEDNCHSPIEHPVLCPFDPNKVRNCPCGKTILDRTTCKDPILCCSRTCSKPLKCGHRCEKICHLDPCGPCSKTKSMACLCGRITKIMNCSAKELRCEYSCDSLLECNQHRCEKICCLGNMHGIKERFKQLYDTNLKFKKNLPVDVLYVDEFLSFKIKNVSEYHNCERLCSKRLKCLNHYCHLPCHSGSCPSCMEIYDLWDESLLQCACGRTTLTPPLLCGTSLPPICEFDCIKPNKCGHSRLPHKCHSVGDCPPCSHLTDSKCSCGLCYIPSVPCYQVQAEVFPSCGNICQKEMSCGSHYCKEICHQHLSVKCSQDCLKPQVCGHLCTSICHADDESECPTCGKSIEIRSSISCEGHPLSVTVSCKNLIPLITSMKLNFDPVSTEWRNSNSHITLSKPYCCELFQRLTSLGYCITLFSKKDELINFEYLRDNVFPPAVSLEISKSFVDENLNEMLKFKYENDLIEVLRYKPMSKIKRKALHFIAESLDLYSYSIDKNPYRSICVERVRPNFILEIPDDNSSREGQLDSC